MDKPVGRLIWSRIRVSMDHKGFRGGSDGKESAYKPGDLCSIPGLGRSLGEGKWQPTPASILAWRIPWTEEPGRL